MSLLVYNLLLIVVNYGYALSPFPIIIPPYNNVTVPVDSEKYGSCLLYSEGINLIVYSKGQKHSKHQFAIAEFRSGNANWYWQSDDATCTDGAVGKYKFTVRIVPRTDVFGFAGDALAFTILKGTEIKFTLEITGKRNGWWHLSSSQMGKLTILKNGDFLVKNLTVLENTRAKNMDNIGLQGVRDRAWGCHSSQAVFFHDESGAGEIPDNLVGISVYNTEIQPFGAVQNSTIGELRKIGFFTSNMDDCIGTFSTGSLTGIIVTVVLLGCLVFAVLMLQSVKTVDRFDNPKQKQLVINVKDRDL